MCNCYKKYSRNFGYFSFRCCSEDGVKTTYSTQQMRRKILNLLKYSVTRYEKAKKIPLFRYTVYTPQEQVKEILNAKPEERFEILKEVS